MIKQSREFFYLVHSYILAGLVLTTDTGLIDMDIMFPSHAHPALALLPHPTPQQNRHLRHPLNTVVGVSVLVIQPVSPPGQQGFVYAARHGVGRADDVAQLVLPCLPQQQAGRID